MTVDGGSGSVFGLMVNASNLVSCVASFIGRSTINQYQGMNQSINHLFNNGEDGDDDMP